MYSMNETFQICHVTGGLHPNGGGTSKVVIDLTDNLAKIVDFKVLLVSQSRTVEGTLPSTNPHVQRVIAESRSDTLLRSGLPIRFALKGIPFRSSKMLVHGHGVWMAANHWTASYARRLGVPLLLQPHGMLEPWAMNYKFLKKKMAMLLYQQHDLQSAAVLIATAQSEYQNLRTLGLRQPIAVIPNGVDIHVDTRRSKEIASKNTLRNVLFLSRVQEKKGLLNLVDAWSMLRPDGWCLNIAGPDEDGHLSEVMARVSQKGISASVNYVGAVAGQDKSDLYSRADLFVLPTFSENFGVVVAEALAHGVPVITTRGAPWQDLETYCCGWWIDIGVDPLVQALRQALALSDSERQTMGARGRDYVQRYNWNGIAQQTAEVYRWVLGHGSKPACVHTD